MSRVFVAQETSLGRHVVVKVLPPDLAGMDLERFRREIRLAARLQHPHVVPLLTAGETDGLPYFTMPYIAGESLRTKLVTGGELPVQEAVRILRQVASALAYAHEHGVVHRDIKPDNVLLSNGEAMVTDFGVAKALTASTTAAGTSGITSLGVALGTPAYMAPEQAAADPNVDHRADIYAWGVMAYELLTGQPPFPGRTPQAVLAAHVSEAPEPITKRRSTVPSALATLVMRCLEKRPADRPQSAGELLQVLDAISTPSGGTAPTGPVRALGAGRTQRRRRAVWMTAALALLVIVIGSVIAWRTTHAASQAAAGAIRLAVLPFQNAGPASDDYFADGITDEVRGKLAALPELRVIASTSSDQYKRTTKTPQQIGAELGVPYLLTATIRWEKDADGTSRVRVTPELVQVSDGTTKWQQSFDGVLSDVFQVQGQIAEQVADALNVALGAGEKKTLEGRPTANLAAYEAYLRGNALMPGVTEGPGSLRQAAGAYEQAVALDPTFALAWARLSQALSTILYTSSATSPEDAVRAEFAARRALALAPGLPQAHLALGDFYRTVRGDVTSALDAYEAGRRIAPHNPELMVALAKAEQSQGDWTRALRLFQEAQSMDPRSLIVAQNLTSTLLWLREYDAARTAADQMLAIDSSAIPSIEERAMIPLAEGHLDDARAVLRTAAARTDETHFVAFVATYWDLYWALDDDQRSLLLRLTPAAFGDDRVAWGLALAGAQALAGHAALSRIYADSARIAIEADLATAPRIIGGPSESQEHVLLGVAYAYLGRAADAVREGERGVALEPVSRDAYAGPYVQHQLARIYTLLGQQDRAVSTLAPLLKIPYYLSPAWLRIDPTFAPLRDNPAFKRLVAGQ
jgi:serine/threonine-protein kinase